MAIVEQHALAPLDLPPRRLIAAISGFAVMTATAFMLRRAALEASSIIPLACAGLAGLSVGALVLTLEDAALPKLTRGVLAGSGLLVLGAFADSETRLRLFSLASVAFGAALVLWLARTAQKRPHVSLRLAAMYAATLAVLSAYAIYLVLVSRDLMIADFMTYRGISIMIARLADAGNWPLLMSAAAQSITQDYAWGPALIPGLALALTQPLSRAIYTFALLALYAAPALLALAILARDLARRAGLRFSPTGEGTLPLAAIAGFFAYPAAFAVAARGMPDVGGLVLTVCALRLADRLARLLALGQGHDARIAPMIRRVALALALTFFAMFAFRRWYAFAAAGIAAMLAIEAVSIAVRAPGRFRWKDAVAAAALGALTLLALSSPVIVDWLPNLGAHDYARSYAAYRKPPEVLLRQLGDWIGLLPALAALGAAALLWTRSADRRLLRLTLGSAAIAAALFLRIQSPYVHHLCLIAPAIAAPVAASYARLREPAARCARGIGCALRDHPLAACRSAQSFDASAGRRAAARASRRPRGTRSPQGLGRSTGARRRKSLWPRLELYLQRPVDRRIVAAASGAGDGFPA